MWEMQHCETHIFGKKIANALNDPQVNVTVMSSKIPHMYTGTSESPISLRFDLRLAISNILAIFIFCHLPQC